MYQQFPVDGFPSEQVFILPVSLFRFVCTVLLFIVVPCNDFGSFTRNAFLNSKSCEILLRKSPLLNLNLNMKIHTYVCMYIGKCRLNMYLHVRYSYLWICMQKYTHGICMSTFICLYAYLREPILYRIHNACISMHLNPPYPRGFINTYSNSSNKFNDKYTFCNWYFICIYVHTQVHTFLVHKLIIAQDILVNCTNITIFFRLHVNCKLALIII